MAARWFSSLVRSSADTRGNTVSNWPFTAASTRCRRRSRAARSAGSVATRSWNSRSNIAAGSFSGGTGWPTPRQLWVWITWVSAPTPNSSDRYGVGAAHRSATTWSRLGPPAPVGLALPSPPTAQVMPRAVHVCSRHRVWPLYEPSSTFVVSSTPPHTTTRSFQGSSGARTGPNAKSVGPVPGTTSSSASVPWPRLTSTSRVGNDACCAQPRRVRDSSNGNPNAPAPSARNMPRRVNIAPPGRPR
jgi:hypothetical protein